MGYVSEIVHGVLGRPVSSTLFHRPRGPFGASSPDGVSLTWLGTAGLAIEHEGEVLLIDPFVTRPGLRATVAGPLVPDPARVRRLLPEARMIVATHSHHDHILDIPEAARQTDALVMGSESTCNYCRASGLAEERLRQVEAPAVVEEGPFRVEVRRSLHGKAVLGRIPLRGEIPAGVRAPCWLRDFRTTGTFGVHLRVGDGGRQRSIFHLGSADFLPETVEGLSCDVLVLCLVGRARRPGYLRDLLQALRPKTVIPCHYDDFFVPMERRTRQLPGVDLSGFIREIEARGDGTEAVVLDKLCTYTLP